MATTPDLTPKQLAKLNRDFILTVQLACQDFCIPKLNAQELTTSEKTCLDHCVAKYYEANDLISRLFSEEKLK